jgi:cold shock CspA family protein
MASGEIRSLKTEQGYGYIREAGAAEDIFFHASSLLEGTFDRLSEGQFVEFDRTTYAKAPSKARAVNVRPISREAQAGWRK